MSECVCGADEPCDLRCEDINATTLHGYPCGDCEREWREANPATAAAISRFASGKGSAAQVAKARHTDREQP